MSAPLTELSPEVRNRAAQRKHVRRETNVGVGGKLKNGATLLAQSEPVYPDSTNTTVTVVLAVTEGYQPFVTWRRIRALSDNGEQGTRTGIVDYCDLGHYYRTLDEALADFKERR